MDVLQKRILIIFHIEVISWDIQILKRLLSTGNYINHLLSTEPIMFGLMNIILVYPYNTIILLVIYSSVNILKVIFIIQTSSHLFRVYLILDPLRLVIQQLSNMKWVYLPLEKKLVLIYWMMNILQSHISLTQSQIHQPFINFQHSLKKCVDHRYQWGRAYHSSRCA